MLRNYKKTDATLLVGKAMLNMKKMKAELNEHRYHLERNVELRMVPLLKRIALLESCNTRLCDKLALVYRELAALKSQSCIAPMKEIEPTDRIVKLYVMGNQTQKLLVSNAQDKWDEQATAA